jgi:hypothetical protein
MATQSTSQSFVPVRDVRQGVIIMKDGSYRGVLMASSQNFALKSTVEQDAIIGAFQTFLNTLDFSAQIVMQSRQLDIRPYLESLRKKEAMQVSDLMRIQLREYQTFIREFTDRTRIMRKYFYVVVPYVELLPSFSKSESISALLPFGKKTHQQEKESFEAARAQLEQRMAVVAQGLAACDVRTNPLSTEEILELLYRSFNPGLLEGSQSIIESYAG